MIYDTKFPSVAIGDEIVVFDSIFRVTRSGTVTNRISGNEHAWVDYVDSNGVVRTAVEGMGYTVSVIPPKHAADPARPAHMFMRSPT